MCQFFLNISFKDKSFQKLSDAGKKFELRTAKKLNDDGIEITDLGNEIKGDAIKPYNNNQITAGDRDIGTPSHLIECKTTLRNRSASDLIEQLGKMIADISSNKGELKQFVNPLSKKVILYTEEALKVLTPAV